jgi:hypothetical protein
VHRDLLADYLEKLVSSTGNGLPDGQEDQRLIDRQFKVKRFTALIKILIKNKHCIKVTFIATPIGRAVLSCA